MVHSNKGLIALYFETSFLVFNQLICNQLSPLKIIKTKTRSCFQITERERGRDSERERERVCTINAYKVNNPIGYLTHALWQTK